MLAGLEDTYYAHSKCSSSIDLRGSLMMEHLIYIYSSHLQNCVEEMFHHL